MVVFLFVCLFLMYPEVLCFVFLINNVIILSYKILATKFEILSIFIMIEQINPVQSTQKLSGLNSICNLWLSTYRWLHTEMYFWRNITILNYEPRHMYVKETKAFLSLRKHAACLSFWVLHNKVISCWRDIFIIWYFRLTVSAFLLDGSSRLSFYTCNLILKWAMYISLGVKSLWGSFFILYTFGFQNDAIVKASGNKYKIKF